MSILESMCLWAYGDEEGPYTRPMEDASPPAAPEPAAPKIESTEDLEGPHTELFHNLEDASRHWFDHVQSETVLAAKFAGKVATARSIPDAMAVCQEWISLHAELVAKDGKVLIDDTEKLVETAAQLISQRPLDWGMAGVTEYIADERFATIAGPA